MQRVERGVFDTRVNVTRHFPLIAGIQGVHSDFSQFSQFNTSSSSSSVLIHRRIPVYGSCYAFLRETGNARRRTTRNNTRDSVKRVKREEYVKRWEREREKGREGKREKGIGKTRLDWTRSRHSRKKTTWGKSFFEFQIIPNGSQFVDSEFQLVWKTFSASRLFTTPEMRPFFLPFFLFSFPSSIRPFADRCNARFITRVS